jgi:hypothetical protein
MKTTHSLRAGTMWHTSIGDLFRPFGSIVSHGHDAFDSGAVAKRCPGHRNAQPLVGGMPPANRSLADNSLEHDRKMRLRTEAHHDGHIGYRQLRIEKELL